MECEMTLAWRLGVHAVTIEDDLVLLDEAADAYVCLLDGAKVVSVRADGALRFDPPRAVNDLIEGGLVEHRQTGASPAKAPPAPQARLKRPGHIAVRPSEALLFLVQAWRVAMAVRRWPMARLLATLRAERAAPPGEGRRSLAEACAVFDTLLAWSPFDGECLFRSVLRRRFLMALGHRPDFVIGVRTWPFRAHCWLQSGPDALDDWPERLCAYRPILTASAGGPP